MIGCLVITILAIKAITKTDIQVAKLSGSVVANILLIAQANTNGHIARNQRTAQNITTKNKPKHNHPIVSSPLI